MCYQGKFLYCIPIEGACLALAILNAIGDLLYLMRYAFMWLLAIAMSDEPVTINSFGDILDRDCIEVFLLIILPISTIIHFIFSVLLCNGICQRLPKQVKAYFVYGVAITALATIVSLLLLICDADQLGLQRYSNPPDEVEFRIVQGLRLLLGCVIHSLFLVLVDQTHRKLVEGTQYSDNIHLLKSGNA